MVNLLSRLCCGSVEEPVSQPAVNSEANGNYGEGASAVKVDAGTSSTVVDSADVKLETKNDTATVQTENDTKEAGDVTELVPKPPEYTGAPMPKNESQRWNYLCSLNVLDSEPEQRFDDLTKLCCLVFKAPIALVSLVDKERQWFKSVQGLPVNQTDRKSSFCAWTLLPQNPEVLVVENALDDDRFRDNPLVQGFPNIRFYAGCPLVGSNDMRLGSLCIIDTKPRRFDAESCNMLANMAEMVVREIEKEKMLQHQRQRSELLSKENTQLLRAIDCFSEGIMLVNMSVEGWPIMFVNEAWEKLTAISRDEGFGKGFWDLFSVPGGLTDEAKAAYAQAASQSQSFDLKVALHMKDSSGLVLQMQFRSAGNNQMDSNMPLIGIPSILAAHNTEGGPNYYFAVCSHTLSDGQITSKESALVSPFNLIPSRKPFDDVRLGPLLGKGAYGRVYRGTWNGAQVAVKVIEHFEGGADGAPGPGLLEAGLHDQVSHPNVVQTYKHDTRSVSASSTESGKTLMETWMVLEFCNRGSLSDAVDRGWFKRLSATHLQQANLAYVLATAKEIAGAMCYLHSLGILHGDLTGNNILLSTSDKDERGFTVKVADFGLSRVLAAGVERISTRTYGTVTHMPPELLLSGVLSKSADVYAFGVVLWEIYVGERPYSGMSHGQIIHQITAGKALEFPRGTPSKFSDLALKCMAKEPENRLTFLQVLDLIEDLAVEDPAVNDL